MATPFLNKLIAFVDKAREFGTQIAFINYLVNHYNIIIPEGLAEKLYETKHKLIINKLNPFVSETLSKIDNYDYDSEVIQTDKLPIWVCWLQGEDNMPEIIKTCFHSILKHAGTHDVKLITLYNLNEYISLDNVITEKHRNSKISNAHFADIIRLKLLEQYGGLWLDATMYCTAPIDELFKSEDFYTIKLLNPNKKFHHFHWTIGCMGSDRIRNQLIVQSRILLEEYVKRHDYMIDYFMLDYFFSILYQTDKNFMRMVDNVPYSNPSLYTLIRLLKNKYDEKTWISITKDTHFFILNWKKYSDLDLIESNKNSYYNFIKNLAIQ